MGILIKVSLMMILMVCLSRLGAAAVYTVGDSTGWASGADYTTWTSDKAFAVGDTLVFNYSPGHTVDEVSQADFQSCTTGNSITTDSSGATKITLKTAGTHYFICAIPGHCAGGMRLAVPVAAAGSTTTAPATTPATATATATTTTTSPVPPTPRTGSFAQPYSAAASVVLSPGMAVMLGFVVVGFKSLVFWA
ncbi:Cupredoxin superfamily protein [Striga hermonthica]|uniref:Cupredoxin superfamily protein n=1 Tax=Striga hermonthica TaxID=68872 RepID=A0A9N7NYE2_STRHE|nr:Cupredoxin superfamily protein [Striga hermonthica]